MINEIKKTVLVTGASGFIGSALVRALLSRRYCVVGISRTQGLLTDATLQDPNFCWYSHDFSQEPFQFSEPVWAVYHALSCQPSSDKNYQDFIAANVHALNNVYRSLNNPVFFVYLSTLSVFSEVMTHGSLNKLDEQTPPQPQGIYALSKLIGEELGRELFCDTVTKYFVARFPSLIGIDYKRGFLYDYCQALLQSKHLDVFHQGEMPRYFLHEKDVVEALLRFLTHYQELSPVEIFHFASWRPIRGKDIALFLKDQLRSKSSINLVGEAPSLDVSISSVKAKTVLNFYPMEPEESLILYLQEIQDDEI